MTLDELIEALMEIRQRMPASGTAHVVGVREPGYGNGQVYLVSGRDDDDDDE